MNNTAVLFRNVVLIFSLMAFVGLRAQAQAVPVQRGAKVIHETHHDVSAPLRDLVAAYGQQQPQRAPRHVAPLGRFGNPYSVPPGERDPALQESEQALPPVGATNLLNFDGLTASQSGGVAPPDTNGSVGTTQFVQTVNTAYEVFDKTTGHSVLGPTQINVIFSGFGGACDTGPYFTDPIVLFDKMASRWVASIAGSVDGFQTGLECVAVSTSSDATGSYYRYSFSFGDSFVYYFGDYPKIGTWPDAYYLTVNDFYGSGALQGAEACALDRTTMLVGQIATAQCFLSAERPLYSFLGGTSGEYPLGGVIRDMQGNVYGTTGQGGDSSCVSPPETSGCGIVFKLDTSGRETVLYTFKGGTDGATPQASLVRDSAGNLYGTTSFGGDTSCDPPYGCGTVFKLNTSGHETVLYSFTGGADGGSPYGGLVRDASGNLYGTAYFGGDVCGDAGTGVGCGTVFEIPAGGGEIVLHTFTGADGASPYAGLVRDEAGNLYGTTVWGGTFDRGTVFEVSASGTESVLYSFAGGSDGELPMAPLLRDTAGNLFGTTYQGGSSGVGTVFELSSTGAETLLHTFTNGSDGALPVSGLVQDVAGNFYGTTLEGGVAGYPYVLGTIFQVSTSGAESVVHAFGGELGDGVSPNGGMVRDASGNLYGTTDSGGDGYGTIFEFAPTGTLMPADFDGTTPPPSGEPNFLLSIVPNAPASALSLFKFHVDFTNPANSTLTGPTTIAVKSFNEACGGQGTCVPQAGTSQQLDSLGDRLMFRLAYRNFGGYESLVVNHSVAPGTSGIVAGVRWYEIRNPNGTPTVYQQGTFSSKTNNYWMGSVAMDKNGDMALGFSASSSTTHPSILYTGRMPTDPLGTMESTKTVITGSGSQNGGLSRWGDYSGMAIDPVDDCTFWYTNEYLKTTGSFNWDTRVVSFKFNSCQ